MVCTSVSLNSKETVNLKMLIYIYLDVNIYLLTFQKKKKWMSIIEWLVIPFFKIGNYFNLAGSLCFWYGLNCF